MDELQKLVNDTAREKVNPQEPPSIISPRNNIQPLVQIQKDTIAKVDTVEKNIVETKVATIQ